MERYKFQVSVDLNATEEETGHVTIVDSENGAIVRNIPIQARNREHFMEIAESIKNAFLRGGEQ